MTTNEEAAQAEFFRQLHVLMQSHPNRDLVNQVHWAALESGPDLVKAYYAGVWGHFTEVDEVIKKAAR